MLQTRKNRYFGKCLAVVLRLMLAGAIFATVAFGHAKLLRSTPANGEKLAQPPSAIELTFSEQLQATEINAVVVTDAKGRRVDKKSVVLAEDGKKMVAELEEIGAGILTVEWKALSADDHLMKGKFTFSVTESKPPETNATPNATPQNIEPQISETAPPTVETQSAPIEKSGTNPLQSVVRWLAYLSIMTLFGGFAFLLFVLKPSLKNATNLSGEEKSQAIERAEKRFLGLSCLSLFLIVFSALAALVLQTSTLLETSIAQAFAPSNLWKVLTQTAYGAPWFLQIAATLSIFASCIFIGKRKNAASLNSADGKKTLLWAGLIFSALLLGTLSFTGHARAAQKDYAFAVVSDWLHLIAAGIWVGGVFQLALTLPKSIIGFPALSRLSVLARVIPRFSGLAISATILLALTGIYNSWIHLVGVRDLITTPYGITLLVKIILFLLMLPLGGFNRFFIRPRVEKLAAATDSGEHSKTIKDFYFVMILEAAFAVAILLLAAMLAFLPHSQEHHAAAGKSPNYIAINIRND